MNAGRSAKHAVLLALGSLALLKAGALLLCPGGRCRAPAFDSDLLMAVHAWRTPLLDDLFALVTWAGSLYVLMPLALLLAALDRRAQTLASRCFVPLALFGAWAMVHIAKLLVARPRPTLFEPLIALPVDASFPSAHAAQIAAFACACLLRPTSRPRLALILAMGLAVVTVGVSRVYLQVHYPSDVLFAIGASALWVLALRRAQDAMDARP